MVISGPHRTISCTTVRERFLAALFDRLWEGYRSRVDYVRIYEEIIARAGATFVNDHIAFRTFASSELRLGIANLSRIFEALGYRPAACYIFDDKHLNAIHFYHPHRDFPKLFISEFRLWEVDGELRRATLEVVKSHRAPLADDVLARLAEIDRAPITEDEFEALLDMVLQQFHQLPWDLPTRQAVVRVNQISQYAAWVLVHGYHVNHFTSLINSHQVPSLNSMEKTVAALAAAGVPMKADIEGAVGSKLRQSATQAVTIDVEVRDGSQPTTMPWSYAYFELAERGEITDPETGRPVRFEGFLGPQATNLFEMTTVRG